MYYRFKNGVFIEASNFKEAQQNLIDRILNEEEDESKWLKCTCLGFDHSYDCPEKSDEIPY